MIKIAIVSTKGGTGKTTLTANLGALLADMGLRTLIVDADPQPGVSKFYPLNKTAPHGLVELLLGETVDSSLISKTVYPNLDIVLSNNNTYDLQAFVQARPDRAFLLRNKLIHPYIEENYSVVLIDTQGAEGAIQDAAIFAADFLISPVKPETLSAREFIAGTKAMIVRLEQGRNMGLAIPSIQALIYAMDRTKDAKRIADEIHREYLTFNGKVKLLNTVIPDAKAYKEATTLRVPVHCHEITHAGKSDSAYATMHHLVYELFPNFTAMQIQGDCFEQMNALLAEVV